jgi:competence protein ComEC
VSASERSAGKLPNPEVLDRYRTLGARILRTDRHGAITVLTDGEKIEIRPFLKVDDGPEDDRFQEKIR